MLRPIARYALPLLVLICPCFGQTRAPLSARLAAALQGNYHYAPPAPVEIPAALDEEPVLQLEPMQITARTNFHRDVVAAAQRAAAARKAAKFSALTGGLIASKQFGEAQADLGIWPMLVPRNVGLMRQQEPVLQVDFLRIKW